jgi:YfiH family protein
MLPHPMKPFEWIHTRRGAALVCRPVERVAAHLFTTRGWALGTARSGDEAAAWDEVAGALEVDRRRLIRVHQVHGARAEVRRADRVEPADARVRPADDARPHADIILSNDSALALAIQVADCIPLLVADRRTGAVAAAHAGWRGLAARVPIVAVDRLIAEFGSRPADLAVAIGPAIGSCCYEVGEDVRARFEQAAFTPAQLARWFGVHPTPSASNPSMPALQTARRANHWFFDGWQSARDQLESASVPADQIFIAGLCTASHADAFCSYRRDSSGAGRMAGAIRAR